MSPKIKYKFTEKQKNYFKSKYSILSLEDRNACFVNTAVLGILIYFLIPAYLLKKLVEFHQSKSNSYFLAVMALVLGYGFWMRRRHMTGQTPSMVQKKLFVLDCQTLLPIKGFRFFLYQCKDTLTSLKLLISEISQKNRTSVNFPMRSSGFSNAIQLETSSLNLPAESGEDDSLVLDETAVAPRPRFLENDSFCQSPVLIEMDESFGVVVVSLAPVDGSPAPKLKASRQI